MLYKIDVPALSCIFPLPKGKKFEDLGDVRQFNADKKIGDRAAFYTRRWSYAGCAVFEPARCAEHKRIELVPYERWARDLRFWYEVGRHPRFLWTKVLYDAGAQYWETRNWEVRRRVRDILKKVNTPRQFLKAMEPHLRVYLTWRGRRYRVSKKFQEKFLAKSFTVKDFLHEHNQELRRIMLTRGVNIKRVLENMTVVAQDDEGVLYDYVSAHGTSRYLYVKCPSTGQEYLLSVPTHADADGNAIRRIDGESIPLDTPKKARRWTFGLPPEAEFVEEA